ncbi:TniQ family protein [Streptomyces chrestomyceticus]|uniref:TniQ family protein n=1 Tax=Streptomyces chrestomyceticus TaxID=68185 RepID=A0ABU7WQS7_9ACTN
MHIRTLPLSVRFVAGESTGSYVTRLAARNGLPVARLLESVGEGLSAAEVDPRYTELYMNAAGRERLAALTGRGVGELKRALPSTADAQLLADGAGGGPVWRWPWRPRDGYLVRGCALCAAARGAEGPIWLICPDPWHICVRHARMSDNSRDDIRPFIDLSPGPHVVAAERQRVEFVRRLGPAGRTLVADAFGVLAHESTGVPRLGERRTTPLRLLPLVMKVAGAMVSVERRRLAGRLTRAERDRWLGEVYGKFGWRVGKVIEMWSRKHPPLSDPAGGERGTHLPLAVPHEQVGGMSSVDELTCVPWNVLAVIERPYG